MYWEENEDTGQKAVNLMVGHSLKSSDFTAPIAPKTKIYILYSWGKILLWLPYGDDH